MRSGRGWAPKIIALFVYVIVILVAAPEAQQPVAFSGSPGSIVAGPAASSPSATPIDLLVGRSTILNVGATIARVSLTVPDVADAMVTAPQQLLIHGKAPGTISLFVWDRAGGIKTYEVNVRRDLKALAEQFQQLFPGEPITVSGSGHDVLISGTVSSKYVIDKAVDVAAGYVEKKENVINLLKQQEGVASNQVMLRVRFAEVSRSALQQLGASFVANGYKNDWFGRTTTQQFAAPDFDSDRQNGLTFSDFLNIFLFNSKHEIGAVVKALQSKGLFQSLAEPNLIATDGKEASFLAGGEYPYPVAQAGGGNTAITIQFKEFGVRLTFTPTVLGDGLIDLKVKPEVSSLDFANGVSVSGFRVPALSTRRTETEVQLQDGQTFAIAGLMNNTVSTTMSKIPGIGDIPILGYLFRSREYQKNQTELVVMITPQVMRRNSTGVSEGMPTIQEPYLGAPAKRLPQPPPYVGSPRYPASAGGVTQTSGDDDSAKPSTAAAVPSSPAAAKPAPAAVETRTVASTPTPTVKPQPESRPRPPQPQSVQPQPQSVQPQAQKVQPQASVAMPSQVMMPQAQPAAPAVHAVQPAPVVVPAVKPPSKAEMKRLEEQRQAEQRKAEAEAKKKAEADRVAAEQKKEADAKAEHDRQVAARKAADEKARQDKLDAERAKREAAVAKKAADDARKKQEARKKQDKALSDAADRLRDAQAAYQAELARSGGKGKAQR
jgi:pilus assembly protein CpaC